MGGAASTGMGSGLRCKPRRGVASEKPHCGGLPCRCGGTLLAVYSPDLLRSGLEKTSTTQWPLHHPVDCCTLAYSRYASESALLQLYDEERPRGIPWLFLVFLY